MDIRHKRNVSLTQPEMPSPEQSKKASFFTQTIQMQETNHEHNINNQKRNSIKPYIPSKVPPLINQYQIQVPLDSLKLGMSYPKCLSNDFARNIQNFNIFGKNEAIAPISMKINNLCSLPIAETLYLLDCIISGCGQAKKMFGWTNYCIDYFFIQKNGKVFTDFKKLAQSKEKVSNENFIVQKIMDDIVKFGDSKIHDFYSYYQRNLLKNPIDFKYAASLIKSYILCSKINPVFCLSIQFTTYYPFNEQYKKTGDNSNAIRYKPQSKINTSKKKFIDSICKMTFSEKSQKIIKSKSSQKKKLWQTSLNGLISPIYLNFSNTKGQASAKSQKVKIQKDSMKSSNSNTHSSQFSTKFSQKTKKKQIQTLLKSIHFNTEKKNSLPEHQRSIDKNSLKNYQKSISAKQNMQQKVNDKQIVVAKNQLFPALLNDNIIQVSSHGSFSDVSQYSPRSSMGTMEEANYTIAKQNQKKILAQNHWHRTIDNLFKQKKQIQVSLILKSSKRKQPYKNNQFQKPISQFQEQK